MRNRTILAAAPLIGLAAMGFAEPLFTTDFYLELRQFKATGGNPYFNLDPGRFWRYEGTEDGEKVRLDIKNLEETKLIGFKIKDKNMVVSCRIVEEREWHDGEIAEVSRNFFARDLRGDVFYLGEQVDLYENGKIVGHEGSWKAGAKGALPGLFMPQIFLLGARYQQEIAPDVAMDRAEHVEMSLKVKTPAGEFKDCVKTRETTPLEPDAEEFKIYAPGVGLIVDGPLKLVEFH